MSRLSTKLSTVNEAVIGYLDDARTALEADRLDDACAAASRATDLLRRLSEVERVVAEAVEVKISADAAAVAVSVDIER